MKLCLVHMHLRTNYYCLFQRLYVHVLDPNSPNPLQVAMLVHVSGSWSLKQLVSQRLCEARRQLLKASLAFSKLEKYTNPPFFSTSSFTFMSWYSCQGSRGLPGPTGEKGYLGCQGNRGPKVSIGDQSCQNGTYHHLMYQVRCVIFTLAFFLILFRGREE